ncbi:MAG: riboflavin biosynthesis protein RibF [Pirellulales bacterium]|nr:riboflavin biosynthesis protein RibF [Pirellulales bacterium]
MKLIRHFEDFPADLRGGALTVGNFDGVHRGHAQIIARLIAAARRVGGPAVVFTFDPHPVRLLRPDACPPPLTWTDRKADLLAKLGVDALISYPTNEQMLKLSAGEFFDTFINGNLATKAMVEGPNFFFGHNREGDTARLREFCNAVGISLEIVDALHVDDAIVSSSRVRKLIAAGDVDTAANLLTEPYRIRGMVTHGAGRGGQIGFPTANIDAIDTLTPAAGVYGGATLARDQIWPAAINIGPNPTFGEQRQKVEVHLLGFEGNLYGQPLEVDFHWRVRDVVAFEGPEQLTQQIQADIHAISARTIDDQKN